MRAPRLRALVLAAVGTATAFVTSPLPVAQSRVAGAAGAAASWSNSATRRQLTVVPVEGIDAGVVIVASPTDYGHFTARAVALVFERSTEATKAVVVDNGTAFTIGEMTSLDMGPLSQNRLYRGGEDGGSGVVMIHMREGLEGAQRIGDTGLFVGGLAAAKEAVTAGQAEASDFKFYFNFMRWSPGGLEEQIANGKWLTVFLPEQTIVEQTTSKGDKQLWPTVQRALKAFEASEATE